jgi:hypothetical protein
MPRLIINPKTGRRIFVGGPTYQKLKESGRYKDKVVKLAKNAKNVASKTIIFPGQKLKTRKIKYSKTASLRRNLDNSGIRLADVKKMPGCGSLGKYKKSDGPFCGPLGGACERTFPVGTKKRAINALSRSINAPNPSGIRKCATDYAVKKGWITKEDKQRLLEKYE